MKMISPTRESEKAISAVSLNLVNGIKRERFPIDILTYSAGSPFSFFRLIKKLKIYDTIHIQHEYNLLGYYGLPFFFVFSFLSLLNKKIITSMHTVLPKKERIKESSIKSFLRKNFYVLQNWFIKKTSDLVIVNEDFLKKILIEDYNFEHEKITVIPQPLIEKPLLISKFKAKKELGITGKMFLIIGNLTEDVGADIIIRKAGKIGKTIIFATNPRGVNVRSRTKTQNYINFNKEIVRKNKFEKFVRFDLKEIPNDLWWKYFSAADIILQAYRGGIRSGIFSDAMAAEVPVIASNIPFFREMAKKYRSLKIAKKGEDYPILIKEAIKPKEYQRMKKECKRYKKENSLSIISQKYKKIYFNLNNPTIPPAK